MPQTEIKLEFFTCFTTKDLLILAIARTPDLWISLCINLFHRINRDLPEHDVTIIVLFIIILIRIDGIKHIAADNLCHVDITKRYFLFFQAPSLSPISDKISALRLRNPRFIQLTI